MLRAMGEDRVERRDVDRGVRADRVGASRVQLLERVGRVTGEHHMPAGVINADHRDVTGGVPGRRDGDDPSVIAERPAVRERAEWAAVERERLGSEPWRERLAQHAAHDPCHRRAEESQLRTAQRLTNLLSVFCLLSWRVFWITMLNRSASDAPSDLALSEVEIALLDHLVKDRDQKPLQRKIYPTI